MFINTFNGMREF